MILDELATMWKEAKVTCFKVLPGIRVKNQGMPQKNLSGTVAFPARSQTGICWMHATSVTTWATWRGTGKMNGIKVDTGQVFLCLGVPQNVCVPLHLMVTVMSWLQSNGESLDWFEQNVGHPERRSDLVFFGYIFHSPVAGFSLLIFEVSRSHTTKPHSR